MRLPIPNPLRGWANARNSPVFARVSAQKHVADAAAEQLQSINVILRLIVYFLIFTFFDALQADQYFVDPTVLTVRILT